MCHIVGFYCVFLHIAHCRYKLRNLFLSFAILCCIDKTSCEILGSGFTSTAGASSCELCQAEYFWVPASGDCVACPKHANCQDSSGNLLPAPKLNFWLSTTSADDFEENLDLYSCPRLTCKGSNPGRNTDCWHAANISRCDADSLLCRDGARGPLCGSCSKG